MNELITKEYIFRKILVIHLYIVKHKSNKMDFNVIFHIAALIILKHFVNSTYFLLKYTKLFTLSVKGQKKKRKKRNLYPELPQKLRQAKCIVLN